MVKNKKIVLLAIVLLLSVVFTSCGSNSTSVANVDGEKQQTEVKNEGTTNETDQTNEQNDNQQANDNQQKKEDTTVKSSDNNLDGNKVVVDNEDDYLAKQDIKVITWASPKFLEQEVKDDEEETIIPVDKEDFAIQISFDEELEVDAVKSLIDVSEYKDNNVKVGVSFNVLRIQFYHVETGKQYVVKIPKELKDIAGRNLKDDIVIKVRPIKVAEAHYKIQGNNRAFEYPEGVKQEENIKGNEPQLTDESKTVQVSFTNDVDKKSVKEIIEKYITKNDADYTLEWKDDRTLYIQFNSFKRTGLFQIPLSEAVDKYEFNIRNDLFFNVDQTNELSYWDIKEKQEKKVKVFHDKRYSLNYNSKIDNYLLLADQDNEFVFDKEDNTIKPLFEDLGFPKYLNLEGGKPKIQWLNQDTALFYQESTNSIVSFSFSGSMMRTIVNLNKYMKEVNVIEIKVSPDGKKIAVANSSYEGNIIYVFSDSGDMIYKGENINLLRKGGESDQYPIYNLGWLSNDEIIYESAIGYKKPDQVNILKTNINTKATETVVEGAINPEPFPDFESVMVIKYDNINFVKGAYTLITPKGEYPLFNAPISTTNNFHMLENQQLIYNRLQSDGKDLDVVLIDIFTGEKTILGKGKIIGTSEDKTKIYYVSNQKFLLPIVLPVEEDENKEAE